MRSLNLDYLRTFVTVVEQGGFSAAAHRLNLTQPAGAELLAHAGPIDAAVTAALDAVARHATGTLGRVRLGTGATACIFLLPPVLRQLSARCPDLEITVTTGNTADIVRSVEENAIDVALVTLPAAGRMLDVAPVLKEEFVAIASPDADLPERVTPAALSSLPVILFEPGGNTRRVADAWFADGGVALKPAMSLGSVEAIKELVAAGLGCAILPASAVRTRVHGAALQIRSLYPPLHRTLATVVRRDKPRHRGLRETLRALAALPDV